MSGYSRRQVGRFAFYASAAVALVLDQVTKAVARATLDLGNTVEVVPGFFTLNLTYNPGAAFGAFGSLPVVLILIGLVAVLIIAGIRKERSKSRALAVALGLLLGGTMGNLVDRIRFGAVTDFLDFAVTVRGRVMSWPTFNVADIAITIGVILLAYHVFFVEHGTSGDDKPGEERNKK